jgi:hypothetical protein
MKYLATILVLILTSCAPAYQDHVVVEGTPTHTQREPRPTSLTEPAPRPRAGRDTRSIGTIIGQAAHFAVQAASTDVLDGWTVYIRPDGDSYTHCQSQAIYVDADAVRWRDHLAHEVTHAVLCEMRPGTEAESHEFMHDHGLCYGSPLDACGD